MRPKADIGLDLGATLTKAVAVAVDAPLTDLAGFACPRGETEALAGFVSGFDVRLVGATGAGAHRDAPPAGLSPVLVNEFEAWGRGEKALIERSGMTTTFPHLLVSLGTGTSILRVDADGRVTRVGGTALGGGTIRGLSRLLVGTDDHAALAALAVAGNRAHVDLLVSDLYRAGEIALGEELTAANFGRVESHDPADLAHSVARLVAENVALLAGALASGIGRELGLASALDVLYAGSTLRGHEALRKILAATTHLAGAQARFLPDGELAGALGALASARAGLQK
jgi:type II pantothenate kinase